MTTPCKDCADRFMGCHKNCFKYIEWKRAHNEQQAFIRAEREKDNQVWAAHHEAWKRSEKKAKYLAPATYRFAGKGK